MKQSWLTPVLLGILIGIQSWALNTVVDLKSKVATLEMKVDMITDYNLTKK